MWQLSFILVIFLFAPHASSKLFDIDKLPVGKSVTLLKPAHSKLSLPGSLRVSATDSPQTLSLTLSKARKSDSLDLAIFDSQSEKVQYITLSSGKPFWYTFKGLSTIQITAKFPSTKGKRPLMRKPLKGSILELSSDKPLTVSR